MDDKGRTVIRLPLKREDIGDLPEPWDTLRKDPLRALDLIQRRTGLSLGDERIADALRRYRFGRGIIGKALSSLRGRDDAGVAEVSRDLKFVVEGDGTLALVHETPAVRYGIGNVGLDDLADGVYPGRGEKVLPGPREVHTPWSDYRDREYGRLADLLSESILYPPGVVDKLGVPLEVSFRLSERRGRFSPIDRFSTHVTENPFAWWHLLGHDRSVSHGILMPDGRVVRLVEKGCCLDEDRQSVKNKSEHEIPGGGDLRRLSEQYRMAAEFQSVAIGVLGRPARTPQPLQLKRMLEVPTKEGNVPVADFFASGVMTEGKGLLSAETHQKVRQVVGGYLKGKRVSAANIRETLSNPKEVGVRYVEATEPAVYDYMLDDTDLRVADLIICLGAKELEPPFISRLGAALGLLGVVDTPANQRQVVDNTLQHLFSVNGQEFKPIMRETFIQGGEFDVDRYLQAVWESDSIIMKKVLMNFAGNFGETVGFGHGAGFDFGGDFKGAGGSVGWRNVRVNGGLTDLEKVGRSANTVKQEEDLAWSLWTLGIFTYALGAGEGVLTEVTNAFLHSYSDNYLHAGQKTRNVSANQLRNQLNAFLKAMTAERLA